MALERFLEFVDEIIIVNLHVLGAKVVAHGCEIVVAVVSAGAAETCLSGWRVCVS